ncbi:uncharacterized protein LOC113085763 [Carassius auratus]|uniref:Uncharacterized protein LOC113085763 n=2 Tax=Carassius auratus TaxID=7957 RepID=A0A6P6NQ62_CARAU|nr:uncharacterized protein LOC113085763 [Carassius auratus]
MARRAFVLQCKHTVNDCTRLLLSDNPGPAVFQSSLNRLQTMLRSLEWAKGTLLHTQAADEIIHEVSDFIQEIQTSEPRAQDDNTVYRPPLIRSGSRGAPSYVITQDQLSFLLSCGFTVKQIAQILHTSISTVKRRLRCFNLLQSSSYSDISDADLDEKIRDIVAGNDQLGPEAVRAQLRTEGIRVQRCRVRSSMHRVNPRAAALRAMSQRLRRRSYRVAGPNSLWHLDGNHKLIRWRIVIHGAIDGYSRLVTFLQASNNNRSSTVMNCFLDAISKYGVPSRVRTDHGGENNAVCLFMNLFRGTERGSALRGRSTHNQRIERLWVDLWRGVSNVYYDLFHFLESEGIVDVDNEMHMWALQYVYIPRINKDLTNFKHQWNNHGLRTERHQSPLQIFVRDCLAQQSLPSTAMQEIFARPSDSTGGETNSAELVGGDSHSVSGAVSHVHWLERVTVPPNQFTVTDDEMKQLTEQIDPLEGPRENLGVNVLKNVLSFVENLRM